MKAGPGRQEAVLFGVGGEALGPVGMLLRLQSRPSICRGAFYEYIARDATLCFSVGIFSFEDIQEILIFP